MNTVTLKLKKEKNIKLKIEMTNREDLNKILGLDGNVIKCTNINLLNKLCEILRDTMIEFRLQIMEREICLQRDKVEWDKQGNIIIFSEIEEWYFADPFD